MSQLPMCCFENLLENSAVTLTQGSEDSNYPLYRTYDRGVGKLFKGSTAASLTIRASQTSPYMTCDRVIIPAGHNLDGCNLRVTRSGDNATYDTVLDWIQRGNGLINVPIYQVDDFRDSSFSNLLWGSSLAGAGSLAETTELTLSGAANADAVIVYGKYLYSRTASMTLGVKAKIASGVSGTNWTFIGLYQNASAPAVPLAGTQIHLRLSLQSATQWRVIYYDTGGTAYYWDNGAGAWTTTAASVSGHSVDNFYTYLLENDGTQWRVIVKDANDAIIFQTAQVPWTSIKDDAVSEYVIFGDWSTTATYGTMTVDWATTTKPYPSYASRYWKFQVVNPPATPQFSELFLTSTYTWERMPTRPLPALDRRWNVDNDMTAGGLDRFIVMGDPKRQRTYSVPRSKPGTAQRDNMLALNEAWQGSKPFWLCDHDGNWIFGKLQKPLDMSEEDWSGYSFVFDFMEVLS